MPETLAVQMDLAIALARLKGFGRQQPKRALRRGRPAEIVAGSARPGTVSS
ncbi:MAG: hypothetical protein ABJN98_01175 [Roseibium sp.]